MEVPFLTHSAKAPFCCAHATELASGEHPEMTKIKCFLFVVWVIKFGRPD